MVTNQTNNKHLLVRPSISGWPRQVKVDGFESRQRFCYYSLSSQAKAAVVACHAKTSLGEMNEQFRNKANAFGPH